MSENINTVSNKNQGTEHQGTKQKFWFGENQDKLFKIGKHKSENWAEIVAYHLAKLLNIPCAEYTSGTFQTNNGNKVDGVISESFINKRQGDRLINANELLAKLVKNYDPSKTYQQRSYTFFGSMALIKLMSNELASKKYQPIQQFIGYLVFDVWIGNQDRHHENWGFVATTTKFYLAPSFDHASSMGCRVGKNEKQKRLNTNDIGYSVEAFAKKARTAMYNDNKILKTYQLAILCCKHYPEEYKFWVEKINTVSVQDITECFAKLPKDWMNDMDKKFTVQLLQANKKELNRLCVKN